MARYDTNQYREIKDGQASIALDPPIKLIGVDGAKASADGDEEATVVVYTPNRVAITDALESQSIAATTALLLLNIDTSLDDFKTDLDYSLDYSITISDVLYQATVYFDVVQRPFPLLISDDDFPPELPKARGDSDWTRVIQKAKARLIDDIKTSDTLTASNQSKDDLQHPHAFGVRERVKIQPGLINNPNVLAQPFLAKALEIAYFEAIRSVDDQWTFKYNEEKERYDKLLAEKLPSIKFDGDDDAIVDASERPDSRLKMRR